MGCGVAAWRFAGLLGCWGGWRDGREAAGSASVAAGAELGLPVSSPPPPLRAASWRRRQRAPTCIIVWRLIALTQSSHCIACSIGAKLSCHKALVSAQTLLAACSPSSFKAASSQSAHPASIGIDSSSARGRQARPATRAAAAAAGLALLLAATACALLLLRSPAASGSSSMVWRQHEITLPAFQRGCHLVSAALAPPRPGEPSAAADRCCRRRLLAPPCTNTRRPQVTQHISGEISSSLRDIKVGLVHIFSE